MIRVTMGYDVRLAESTVEPGSAGAATYYVAKKIFATNDVEGWERENFCGYRSGPA